MSAGKVLLGVMVGAAAGAIMGILFAPAKGSQTRERIMRQSEDYVDDLKNKFNEYIDSVSQKFERVKEDVSAFAKKGEDKLEHVEADVNAFRN